MLKSKSFYEGVIIVAKSLVFALVSSRNDHHYPHQENCQGLLPLRSPTLLLQSTECKATRVQKFHSSMSWPPRASVGTSTITKRFNVIGYRCHLTICHSIIVWSWKILKHHDGKMMVRKSIIDYQKKIIQEEDTFWYCMTITIITQNIFRIHTKLFPFWR